MLLNVKDAMICPSNAQATVMQRKALFKQVPLPRIAASHFPPAGKLTGTSGVFYEAKSKIKQPLSR